MKKTELNKQEMISILEKHKKASHLFGWIPVGLDSSLSIKMEIYILLSFAFLDSIFSLYGIFIVFGMIFWWEYYRISMWRLDLIIDYSNRMEAEYELLLEFPDTFGPDFTIEAKTKEIMVKHCLKKHPKPDDILYFQESKWPIIITFCIFILAELVVYAIIN
jgi:hypothetical protein